MANFEIRGAMGGQQPSVRSFVVASGTDSSIKEGDAVVLSAGAAALIPNGGAVAADKAKYGLALRDSNETAGADGSVEVAFAPEGLVVRGKVTNAGNLSEASVLTSCTIDLVGDVQTIDEDDATGDITILNTFEDGDVDVILPFKL